MILCSVFTDASFSPHRKSAGWAAWMKCQGQKWTGYAPFRTLPQDTSTAELLAAINGVHAAVQHFDPEWIHLVCDCQYVLHRLGRVFDVREHERAAFALFDTATRGRRFTCKHVKAHCRITEPRSWVNDWCDRHARKAMRSGERG